MQNLFSYPLIVEDLTAVVKKYSLEANKQERDYITEVLKVVGTKKFKANINVKFNKKEHLLKVWGKVEAELELMSVISLENFTKSYQPEFELTYDTKLTPKELKEIEFDFEDDVPDLIIDGQIDLAQIAMEQVALVIDDFPRKEGEFFEFKSEFSEETTEEQNPFAVLAKLKK